MINIQSRGYTVPALGFGTWKLEGQSCTDAVSMALNLGYRHIDTAQIYLNEAEVGTALAASSVNRDDIFLTTKIWRDNVSPALMAKSFNESLSKLKTDYVDMLLLHWPVNEVPLREQLGALMEIQKSGRARQIGVSNYTTALLKECRALKADISNDQVEYHPFLNQNTLLNDIRANDMFLTAYSPLARGAVTGNTTLQSIAQKYGKNEGQIALRWLLQQDRVCAIPKAASETNIRNNINIFDFALTNAEMQTITDLSKPDGRLINPEWAPAWDNNKAA